MLVNEAGGVSVERSEVCGKLEHGNDYGSIWSDLPIFPKEVANLDFYIQAFRF